MRSSNKFILRFLWVTLIVFAASFLLSVIEILSIIRTLTNNADFSMNWLEYILMISGFLFMFILLVNIIGLFFDDSRRVSLLVLILCMIFSLAHGYALKKGYTAMTYKIIERLTKNSTQLVNAVKQYEDEHDELPKNLLELMPSYIDNMPETGFQAAPYFLYITGEAAQFEYKQPWTLYVELPFMFDDMMRCAYMTETQYEWECLFPAEPFSRQ